MICSPGNTCHLGCTRTVMTALTDLEAGGHVAVRRNRRPYRYWGCP